MENNIDKIKRLNEKLASLQQRQDAFSKEISLLKIELNKIHFDVQETSLKNEILEETPITVKAITDDKEQTYFNDQSYQPQRIEEQKIPSFTSNVTPKTSKSDLEKFIGENLINKIGIAITIIGVAIGAKYSIENNLISPLTRIILGYLFGLGLLGFSIKLKRNYENFSAVLVSGAMAIMYFITFAAYSFYDLFPQVIAFMLMLFFTIFTVLAALQYNRQIIALIGLVGAYAVPFLLSDGSGKIGVLFSYVAILNTGILTIAFKKYWKIVHFTSFGVTWFIFFTWFVSGYESAKYFGLSLVFSAVFFTIFYLTILAYKLIKKEKYLLDDIVLLLINSFLFYGFGYATLNSHETGQYFLGIFTLANAIIHFIVSVFVYKQNLTDKSLSYLITGFVLVFLTIAIPVQMNGNWVTILWALEAALLFWIGRTKHNSFYEKLSYPLMILAFISIIDDWFFVYDYNYYDTSISRFTTIFNVHFLSSMLFIAAFGFICKINFDKKYISENSIIQINTMISFAISFILLFVIYFAFRLEIANYWNQLYLDFESKEFSNYRDQDFMYFKVIWIHIYSLLFVSILTFINNKKLKNQQLGMINIYLGLLVLLAFLTQGLYVLSEMRVHFLNNDMYHYYKESALNLWIRYVAFIFVGLLLFVGYKNIHQKFIQKSFKTPFEIVLHVTILWITSSELINLMEIAASTQSHKLGLSIFWGLYSLFLIAFGIWKNNKPLRIVAIALFAVTLLKLFFYDITHLNTISKTIVFVSLGILLLIISFLYNKFKEKMTNEESEN